MRGFPGISWNFSRRFYGIPLGFLWNSPCNSPDAGAFTSFLPSLLQETLRSCLCVVRAYANDPEMAPGWPKLCAWQDGAGSQGGVILPCLCVVRAHANVLPAVDAGVSTLRHTRVGGGRRALASRPALTVACQDSTLPASVWASALPASGRASALPASTLGMCTHDA